MRSSTTGNGVRSVLRTVADAVRPAFSPRAHSSVLNAAALNVQRVETDSSVFSSPQNTPKILKMKVPNKPREEKFVKPQEKTTASFKEMSDEEIVQLVNSGKLKFHNLEKDLNNDYVRAVKIRRDVVASKSNASIEALPYQDYNYSLVDGQCCENVVGIVPIPVGVAGPILIDGREFFLPMATTEGCLIASTTRGAKVLSMAGGVKTQLMEDGMSRAPVLQCPNAGVAFQVKDYLENNFDEIAAEISKSSRFARLKEIKCFVAGRKIYIRFKCSTGDAMGMNMVGKGVDKCLQVITDKFPVHVLSLSGNVCTDKKPSSLNWTDGRGKSIVAEATIPAKLIQDVLKTTVDALVEVNIAKNLIGSAIAGSIGGFNAHASNIVTAMFLATGQDPAQNVESSNCMTLMEKEPNGDLYMSVTMPSLEVGTVGGGTSLPGQKAMLNLLGVAGSDPNRPGHNAQTLARVIGGGVMAGELSLLSALSVGHLIQAHMKHNRKPQSTT